MILEFRLTMDCKKMGRQAAFIQLRCMRSWLSGHALPS